MAGFRGGDRDFKRSGGGIGDRDLSGKSKTMSHARGGYAPDGREAPVKMNKEKKDRPSEGQARR